MKLVQFPVQVLLQVYSCCQLVLYCEVIREVTYIIEVICADGKPKESTNPLKWPSTCFVHRKPPQIYTKKTQASTVVQPPHILTVTIEGSRVINVMKLQQYINELTVHSTQCGGSIVLTSEARDGLALILSSHCPTCNHTITLETAQKVKGPRGYR